MDLALELGTTVESLSQTMTERELGQWQRYAEKKLLPMRRLEYYLARLSAAVVSAVGGNASVRDFLLDAPPVPEDTAETGATAIGMVAGGRKVIHLGKRRRNG